MNEQEKEYKDTVDRLTEGTMFSLMMTDREYQKIMDRRETLKNRLERLKTITSYDDNESWGSAKFIIGRITADIDREDK